MSRFKENKKRIAVFAFDPGAANYALAIESQINSAGIGVFCNIYSSELVSKYILTRGYVAKVAKSSEDFENIIDSSDVIMLGTSESGKYERLALTIARKRNKVLIMFLDSSANILERFIAAGCEEGLKPQYIFALSDEDEKILRATRFFEKNVYALENPYYSWMLEFGSRATIKKFISDKPRIGFLSEPLLGLNPQQFYLDDSYTMFGTSGTKLRMHIVLEEFINTFRPYKNNYDFSIRLHPKGDKNEYAEYLEFFDCISKDEGIDIFLPKCDIVFGCTSMGIVDALMMDIPTCSILPKPTEERWLPSIAWGKTKVIKTRVELEIFVREELYKYIREGESISNKLPTRIKASPKKIIKTLNNILQGEYS